MKAFKTLKDDFSRNRRQILTGLVALLIVDVLQLFIPRLVKFAIDDLTSGEISSSRLLVYGLEVLGLALCIGLLRYVWRHLLMGTARRVGGSVRERFFRHPHK